MKRRAPVSVGLDDLWDLLTERVPHVTTPGRTAAQVTADAERVTDQRQALALELGYSRLDFIRAWSISAQRGTRP